MFELLLLWSLLGAVVLALVDGIFEWAIGNKSWKLLVRFFLICPFSAPIIIAWFALKQLVKIISD